MIGNVQTDKSGLRVPFDYAVPRRQQLRLGREILSIERPSRMIAQLLPPFVDRVGRREEGVRVGNVNEDG